MANRKKRYPRKSTEKNNYQDKFSDREYDKGYEEGEGNDKRKGNRKTWGKSKSNDPAWYASDPQILRDAAAMPYSWAVGTPIDFNIPNATSAIDCVPGVQVQYLRPTIGYSDGSASPINIAATATYGFVRYANSGSRNYDSPDLMCYILAMSDVYGYINFLQRVYGTAMLYSQRNRYMPVALLTAMGVDANDVFNNLANLRYGINIFINKVASLFIPSTMPLMNRRAFIYQNIYSEGTSVKDQMYMYCPYSFWQFSPEVPDSTGIIEKVFYPGGSGFTPYTVEQLLQFGNELLAPIIHNEDANIMSGDILKAYGEGGLIKLSLMSEDYRIVPIFDIAVLEQMKNAIPIDSGTSATRFLWNNILSGSTATNYVIYQDTKKQYLISEPCFGMGPGGSIPNAIKQAYVNINQGMRVLTTQFAEVEAGTTIESTRLMYSIDNKQNAQNVWPIRCGTEIVQFIRNFSFKFTSMSAAPTLEYTQVPYVYVDTNSSAISLPTLNTVYKTVADLSNFKFHTNIMLMSVQVTGTSTVTLDSMDVIGTLFDIDNYAIIDGFHLEKMHEAAIMNLLHVPSIGRI